MLGEPLGFQPLRRYSRCRRPDLVLGLQLDALCPKRSVIDPRIDIEFGKPGVDMLAPALPPLLQPVAAVPVAVLLPAPTFADLPPCQPYIPVRPRPPLPPHAPMHIQIPNQPLPHT